jgi:LPXTG-motif cell wall-anchored protein
MLKSKSVFTFSKFLSILISLLLIGIFTNPIAANAEKGYRYWGYFQAAAGATSWTAAMTGPSVEVKDGDVEGWAFVFSSNDIPAANPMMDPDFATLCGDTPQAAGKVRVGLVVDFGAANIAPSGETPREFFSDCVVVDEGSVGLDVLESAMAVNAGDSGLICGIAGYPASECGAEIDAPTTEEAAVVTTTSEEIAESNGSPILLGALGLLLISGFVLARRRNKR